MGDDNRYGVHKLQMKKLARAVVVWRREVESARLIREGRLKEEEALREKASKEDALGSLQGQFDDLQGAAAARAAAAEEESARLQAEVEEWRSKVKMLEEAMNIPRKYLTDGGTEMTPQRPPATPPAPATPGLETLAQRKPSLGSIFADVVDTDAGPISWSELAGADVSSTGGAPPPSYADPEPEPAPPPPYPVQHEEPHFSPAPIGGDMDFLAMAEEEAAADSGRRGSFTAATEPAAPVVVHTAPAQPAVEVSDMLAMATAEQDGGAELGAGVGFIPGSAVPEADLAPPSYEAQDGNSAVGSSRLSISKSVEFANPASAPAGITGTKDQHQAACQIQAAHRGRNSRKDTSKRRKAKQQAASSLHQRLEWAATRCQAIRRGNIWRKRVAVFEKWDKTSGEIDQMVPKLAREDEVVVELPKEHLLVGEHYTPLGLRLARQLFLVFDRGTHRVA